VPGAEITCVEGFDKDVRMFAMSSSASRSVNTGLKDSRLDTQNVHLGTRANTGACNSDKESKSVAKNPLEGSDDDT
jgi:hypothetical protein